MANEVTALSCFGEETEEMKESKDSASANARVDEMSDAGLRVTDGRGDCLAAA